VVSGGPLPLPGYVHSGCCVGAGSVVSGVEAQQHGLVLEATSKVSACCFASRIYPGRPNY
jgi:hypothetical protein